MDESMVDITETTTATEVAISGPLTIQRIDEARSGLLQAFGLGKKVRLSLAAVTEVDVTGLQLLCSAHRTALARMLDFSLGSGCEALTSTAGAAGMLRHIGCPRDPDGSCVWKNVTAAAKEPS